MSEIDWDAELAAAGERLIEDAQRQWVDTHRHFFGREDGGPYGSRCTLDPVQKDEQEGGAMSEQDEKGVPVGIDLNSGELVYWMPDMVAFEHRNDGTLIAHDLQTGMQILVRGSINGVGGGDGSVYVANKPVKKSGVSGWFRSSWAAVVRRLVRR